MCDKRVKSIALFIPHMGCPHKCTFCNQNAIAASSKMPTGEDIERAVDEALKSRPSDELEIAFFGGSFTCISEKSMREYLDCAQRLVDRYKLHGIRFSTRPDGIDKRIMDIVSGYSVTAIELGAQSMDEEVLDICERGHTVQDTYEAAKLISEKGIELVLQMMTGLHGSTVDKDIKSAEMIASLNPTAVRIYPAIVFKNTKMNDAYQKGEYTPQSLDEAVTLCKQLCVFFESRNISIIKLGLNAEKDFDDTMVAGPYHPAFRELVEGEMYFDRIVKMLNDRGGCGTVCYSKADTSRVIGHKKANKIKLLELFGNGNVSFKCDESLALGEILIK
ncbi:MAG: radical SAM protein [Clostridia bacterium]|nr:radical SAM protein [Clostridia bacterium]